MQPPRNTRGCVVPTAVQARGPRAPKTEPHRVHPTDKHGTTAMLTNFRAQHHLRLRMPRAPVTHGQETSAFNSTCVTAK